MRRILGGRNAMNQAIFSFAYRKATQALNFLAQQAGGKLDKMKALKLVFFADRYHLRKYGRLITNDEYFAMDYGPVPSGVKDIVEMGSFLGRQEKQYAERFLSPARDDHLFRSTAEVDVNVLSTSDLEALQFAWDTFGGLSPIGLFRLTHRYPEWKRHENALGSKQVSRMPISYDDFLKDPEPGLNPCFKLTSGQVEDRRETLREQQAFESKWN